MKKERGFVFFIIPQVIRGNEYSGSMVEIICHRRETRQYTEKILNLTIGEAVLLDSNKHMYYIDLLSKSGRDESNNMQWLPKEEHEDKTRQDLLL
jgi:hypothetical protein